MSSSIRQKYSAAPWFYGLEGGLTVAKNWNKSADEIDVGSSAAQGAAIGAGWFAGGRALQGARNWNRGGAFSMGGGLAGGVLKGGLMSAGVAGLTAAGMQAWKRRQAAQPQQQDQQQQQQAQHPQQQAQQHPQQQQAQHPQQQRHWAAAPAVGAGLGAAAGYMTGGRNPVRGAAVWGGAGLLGSLYA